MLQSNLREKLFFNWCTFLEFVSSFSYSMASLQRESTSEQRSLCLTSFLSLPSSIHPSSFNSPLDNGKYLLGYIRREKNTTTTPPPIDSLDPGNTSLHSESEDSLLSTLHKVIRSCTNHPISNFVSCKSLNPSYYTFVNSVSSMFIPFNLKEVIFPKASEEMPCVKKWQPLKRMGHGNLLTFY